MDRNGRLDSAHGPSADGDDQLMDRDGRLDFARDRSAVPLDRWTDRHGRLGSALGRLTDRDDRSVGGDGRSDFARGPSADRDDRLMDRDGRLESALHRLAVPLDRWMDRHSWLVERNAMVVSGVSLRHAGRPSGIATLARVESPPLIRGATPRSGVVDATVRCPQ